MTTYRRTVAMCPVCLEDLPAEIIEEDGKAYLERECPGCGRARTLLSRNAPYYLALDSYFFSVMRKGLRQKDFIIRLLEKCNLNCPICLASANDFSRPDLTLKEYVKLLDEPGRKKIDLMSAEPTIREDLGDFIREAKSRGHIVALHTNGLRLADFAFAEKMKNLGVDEVHLQFDSFRDDVQMKLRGRPLAELKMQILGNLERLGMATDLVMVVSPGLNEDEMGPMIDFVKDKPFVKELFFLGLRSLGKARSTDHGECLMPDEVIDLLVDQRPSLVRREDLFRFQKLYFAMLSFFGVRKCSYIHHYLLLRTKDGYLPARDLFDWEKVERHLDRLPSIPPERKLARWAWLLGLVHMVTTRRAISCLWDLVKVKLRFLMGFNLSRLGGRTLILGFITACDPFIWDRDISACCGKGELSTDVGPIDSGALANVTRERLWRRERAGEGRP